MGGGRFFVRFADDIRAVKERDPAATSTLSVLFNYPGLHAMWAHRVNHWLWSHGRHGVSRWFSQVARWFTGIEIHPGRHRRRPVLHRPRHGCRHRRDDDHRQRRDAVPRSDARRYRQGDRQATPHARGLRRRGRRRGGARQHHGRARQQGGRRRGRDRRRAAQLHRRRRAGPCRRALRRARRSGRPAPRGPARPGGRDVPLPAAPHRPAREAGGSVSRCGRRASGGPETAAADSAEPTTGSRVRWTATSV